MIQILPDGVINKIAAGEVVERPASVVKELVENALDSGARSVDILVRSGGRDFIEVVDDGSGMSVEDARLALKRHATSKISAVEDLTTLETFGFRGEALPSIASVSRFILETSDGNSPEGLQIIMEGGRVIEEMPVARVRGTTIRVEHLFANVPARRKFLKSVQTEYRHIVKSVTEAALSRLDVGFTLRHDQREVFRLRGGRELRQRAAELFGSKALSGAVLLAAELDDLRLRGVLGAPVASRRTAGAVHVFVNGRPVNHRGLSYALFTGYGELLPQGRYPFACLFLEVLSSDVDVNVHPAKREVRFTDEARVKDFVITGVREALGRELGTRTLYRDRVNRGGADGAGSSVAGVDRRVSESDLPWHHTGLFTGLLPDTKDAAASLFEVTEGTPVHEDAREGRMKSARDGSDFSDDPLIWQVHDQYLIAPITGGIIVVDQHAAHERILYEESLRHLSDAPAASQQLLFPRLLELSVEQASVVEEFASLLARVGFDLKSFGGNTVALEAVPPYLERAGNEEEVVLGIIDDLGGGGEGTGSVHEKVAASVACRAAIRFGQRLDPEERRMLVDRLFACEKPQVCPHGRPTHLILSLEELDLRFDR